MFGFGMQESGAMWAWAYAHPYLFTLIKISTPTVLVILMYAASRVLGWGSNRKRK